MSQRIPLISFVPAYANLKYISVHPVCPSLIPDACLSLSRLSLLVPFYPGCRLSQCGLKSLYQLMAYSEFDKERKSTFLTTLINLIWNLLFETKYGLYVHFSDWFGTKRNLVPEFLKLLVYQTEFRLLLNQSKMFNHNPNLVMLWKLHIQIFTSKKKTEICYENIIRYIYILYMNKCLYYIQGLQKNW